MVDTTFQEQLVAALTATNSPIQLNAVEFIPQKHKILGDVPMAVRHLHNLGVNLCSKYVKAEALYFKSIEDLRDKDAVIYFNERRSLLNQMNVAKELKWTLIHTIYPEFGTEFKSAIILENWKVAGVRQLPTS